MFKSSVAAAAILALVGCLNYEPDPPNDPGDVTFTDNVHSMPMAGRGERPYVAPAGAHLMYYGGKVVQSPHVTQVNYGSGTYISQISGTQMGSFYGQAVSSGVFDWLNEYNTSSPAQTIGRGSFAGKTQITPAASHNGSTITDASIQAELAAQIQAGTLPAASDNNIYMVSFPAGKTITQSDGSASCVVFCAYHGTFKIGSQNVYYGVLPDMTGSCASGCGNAPSVFQNQTSVASHELIETVTDAEVGLATVVGPPLAWYDTTNGEIGDICNAQQGTFVGTDSVTYTIQQEFSNQQNDCITTRSVVTTPDFSVSASPASLTIAPGASGTYNVTTTKINSSTQTIALSVSGLPSGVTGTFTPGSVTAGGSSTLTVTASSTASGTGALTITGTSGSTTHTANVSLTVSGSTGGPTPLSNGVPVTGLAGAVGSQANFVLAVPAGQTSLVVTISGGSGDADLYVRAGSQPDLTTYDCRPYITGNAETCTFTNPSANNWFVMLNGYAAYSGVTLKATYSSSGGGGPQLSVSNLSGAKSSKQYFTLAVPAGQTTLVFHTSGGTGDVDMYVRKGSNPTLSTYDCRPYINGNNETCTINSPAAATYHVMLNGYAAYSGVTLTGQYQ